MRRERNLRSLLSLLLVFLVAVPVTTMSVFSPASASGPTLNLPEAQTFATAGDWFDVVPAATENVLSGFSGNVRAVLGVDQGALRVKSGTLSTVSVANDRLSLPGGITVSLPLGYRYATIGNDGNGEAQLAFEGAISDVNAVLKNLQFNRSSAGGSTLSVSAVKAGSSGTVAYDPASQRYYEFFNTSLTWENARCRAKFIDGVYNAASTRFDKCDESKLVPRTFNGLQGYLATVTSAEENTFVASRAGNAQAWVGGSDEAVTRLMNSTVDIPRVEGEWRWVDGPEAGLIFWVPACSTGKVGDCTAAGVSSTARYNNWNGSEPNNSGSEGALQFLVGGTGKWNDLPVNSSLLPFVVEYGGLSDETPDEQLQATVALNVAQNGPPTGISASAGDGEATVSWIASTIVTGALTGYSVTANPGGATCSTTSTSCVVTGLTNGTAYTFTVTAAFSGGSPSRTSVASSAVTPAVAPAQPPSSPPVITPSPTPTSTPAQIRPSLLPPPPQQPQSGPVLQNNQVPAPPVQPQALVNGVPTQVSTLVTDPNNLNIRTGLLNIGINVQNDQGLVRQGTNGETEVQVRSGGTTGFQGTGLAPRSFVQVFMPLQGNNSKELARIPVDENGSFNGEAVFATSLQEAPLPIGRQVLQMVTIDEQGRQNVVEFTVNIAQPAPSPEPNRQAGNTPQLLPGQSLATNAGIPEVVQVTALQDERQTIVEGDGWTMSVGSDNPNANVEETPDGGALIELVRDGETNVSGEGFMPGTRADVWLFSEPTLLGTIEVDENGRFSGTVIIDSQLVTAGEHTLQMQGVGMDGYVRAANLGVNINDEEVGAAATSESAGGFLAAWLIGFGAVGVVAVAGYLLWRRSRALV